MTPPGLPPDLAAFAALLDAQPLQVRAAFNYCLCLMMVEASRMELVQTLPSEEGPICMFRSSAGESFAVARPAMSEEEEAKTIAVLREILEDENS